MFPRKTEGKRGLGTGNLTLSLEIGNPWKSREIGTWNKNFQLQRPFLLLLASCLELLELAWCFAWNLENLELFGSHTPTPEPRVPWATSSHQAHTALRIPDGQGREGAEKTEA